MYQQQEQDCEPPRLVCLGASTWETGESGTHYWNDPYCVFTYVHIYIKYIDTHTHTYFPLVDFNPNQLEKRNSIRQAMLFVSAVCLCGC